MTPEQKYDRWERIARLLYEDATRRSRESRKQTAKLKFYLDADRRNHAARRELAEDPKDSAKIERADLARQALDRAREDLKR